MEVAATHGFLIKLLFIEEGENERFISTCVSQRLSGVIFYTIPEKQLTSLVDALKKRNIVPAVLGNSFSPDECIHVLNDDMAGSAMMIQELYNLGYRKVAYVGNSFLAGDIRGRGYAMALEELGAEIDSSLILKSGDIFEIRDFIANLVKTHKVDAVFCSGDNIAAVVISAIQECGLSVPGDISVAGFGNLACGRFHLPPISTVDESHLDVCVRIIDKIMATLSEKDHGEFYETILPSLIMRQSTGEFLSNGNPPPHIP
jgi:LacI family transcriptional regulator